MFMPLRTCPCAPQEVCRGEGRCPHWPQVLWARAQRPQEHASTEAVPLKRPRMLQHVQTNPRISSRRLPCSPVCTQEQQRAGGPKAADVPPPRMEVLYNEAVLLNSLMYLMAYSVPEVERQLGSWCSGQAENGGGSGGDAVVIGYQLDQVRAASIAALLLVSVVVSVLVSGVSASSSATSWTRRVLLASIFCW